MAQTPISYSTTPAGKLVSSGSRYEKSRVIYYGEQRFITFETYIRQTYERVGNEKVMVVNKGVEYRPDLVSYDYYGYPDNWWKILEVNKMNDIMDFKSGVTIFLPNSGF